MPSLAALIQSGAVTNKYNNLNRYKNVFTLAAGDEAFLAPVLKLMSPDTVQSLFNVCLAEQPCAHR